MAKYYLSAFADESGKELDNQIAALKRNRIRFIELRGLETGPIDAYYDYCYGALEYRSLRFEDEVLPLPQYQPVAVVNYNEREIPFTRIIEHKHFVFGDGDKTVITREYPAEWSEGAEPYYPVNDGKNQALYDRYRLLSEGEDKVLFGGRLGQYRYYDMDKVVAAALALAKEIV